MIDQDMAGAQDTIYLCNFRVSVDGEWLCLKELQDVEFSVPESSQPSTPSLDDPIPLIARDPMMIERSNLVNISKLIVKELIETSLKYGRMLDTDHMPLQHFFIVLEHVLRHGLKPKKGLLGPKKELWDILQVVEKYTLDAQDITSSVRDLPTVSTHMGRARAWLRLALMQKKLGDYLKILIDHRDDLLSEYFEPDALMMSEEAIIIVGLLVGLNVIDCNLCVKEEDLDCQQGVIDFSLYLRSSNYCSENSSEEDLDQEHMTTVLDQKNYIEELNRHLNATVTNLQSKVETLMTTNALMKEDLAIAKNNILALNQENMSLKKELGLDVNAEHSDEGGGFIESSRKKAVQVVKPSEVEELRQQLENEKKHRQEAEKELDLQISLKAEMEVAMKLLEKDIHEKQDTIVSLRRQLDDIKLINLEMYRKLQECEQELTEKGVMVSRLQAKTSQIGQILNNLEKYNHLLKDAEKSSNGVVIPKQQQTKGPAVLKLPPPHVPAFLKQLQQNDTAASKKLQQSDADSSQLLKSYATLKQQHQNEVEISKEGRQQIGCEVVDKQKNVSDPAKQYHLKNVSKTSLPLQCAQIQQNGSKMSNKHEQREKNVCEIAKECEQLKQNGSEISKEREQLHKNGSEISKEREQLHKNGSEISKERGQLYQKGSEVSEQNGLLHQIGSDLPELHEQLQQNGSEISEKQLQQNDSGIFGLHEQPQKNGSEFPNQQQQNGTESSQQQQPAFHDDHYTSEEPKAPPDVSTVKQL